MLKVYNVRSKYEEICATLDTGDYGDQFGNYGSGCIDDIIAEIADSNIDIDYDSLFNFAKENTDWCDNALCECGDLGGFINIIRMAERLKIENDLDNHIVDSVKSALCEYASNYINDNISPDDYTLFNTKCDAMVYNIANYIADMEIDSNDRLDDYINVVETYIDCQIEHFDDLLKDDCDFIVR
jgi:hypothetical protein